LNGVKGNVFRAKMALMEAVKVLEQREKEDGADAKDTSERGTTGSEITGSGP
jgi:hypothetical protein